MVVERIRAGDARLARYHHISDPSLLKIDGLFVAEGRFVVRRVIEREPAAVRSVLVNDAAYAGLESALATLPAGTPVFVCVATDFPAITGFNFHRGCLALVERPRPLSMDEVVSAAVGAASPASASRRAGADGGRATLIVLEGVANADNVGGVFRNASAFRAGGVLLDSATCDPLYRKAIRTSMAAVLRVPFARVDPWPISLERLRARGFELAALTPREPAVAIEAFASRRPRRVAVLVGAEGQGLTREAESMADWRVRISIAEDVDSLNLAVAVGIALHRLG